MNASPASFYILFSPTLDKYYCGITTDNVYSRLAKHNSSFSLLLKPMPIPSAFFMQPKNDRNPDPIPGIPVDFDFDIDPPLPADWDATLSNITDHTVT